MSENNLEKIELANGTVYEFDKSKQYLIAFKYGTIAEQALFGLERELTRRGINALVMFVYGTPSEIMSVIGFPKVKAVKNATR